MKYLKKLNSKTYSYSVAYIFYYLFEKNGNAKNDFTLEPKYQRNVVWETKQYIKFIESLFVGIVPSPIIIAIDTKTNKKICVDGKQRLTSIVNFFTNQIPLVQVEKNKLILYWYDEIKSHNNIKKTLIEIYKINNFESKLITPEMKAWIENGFQLNVIQYEDINYEEQIDIFNRIQYGMSISRGSFLKSFITDAKLCEYIIIKANEYLKIFGSYIKNANNEDHIKYMIEMFFMLDKDIITIKSETVEYELKNLTIDIFETMVKSYDKLIKTMYSEELLNSCEIKQKKIINKLLLFAKNKLDDNDFDENKMKKIIDNIYIDITENKKQFKSDELDKYFESYWNEDRRNKKIVKKTFKTISKKTMSKSLTIDSESESESDSESDSDSDSNSIERIIPKNEIKKK